MYGLFAITNHYQNRVGPKVNLIMYLKLLNVSVTDFDLLVFNVFFGSKLKPMYHKACYFLYKIAHIP